MTDRRSINFTTIGYNITNFLGNRKNRFGRMKGDIVEMLERLRFFFESVKFLKFNFWDQLANV